MGITLNDWIQVGGTGGKLGWNSFTESYTGSTRPQIEIPLFLKEHNLPSRKPKITEQSTITQIDPSGWDLGNTNILFYGIPDMLQVTFSGWMITPVTSAFDSTTHRYYTQWRPVDINGNPLNWGNVTYAEIVDAFLAGRLNRNNRGAWQRKDPDYYVDPYGRVYLSPVVNTWEPTFNTNDRKQLFSMTLYLEQ